jgi:cyclic pyranopterin monophosphate synthase
MPRKTLSHLDAEQNPRMVDVSGKAITQRSASAQVRVLLPAVVAQTLAANGYLGGKAGAKGSILHTAIIAGVQAAKQTHALIPFCHAIALERCDVRITPLGNAIDIVCSCSCQGKTGVEMEALTGASVAALCIYDMCKALSHDIMITDLRLLEKSGGKSSFAAPKLAKRLAS